MSIFRNLLAAQAQFVYFTVTFDEPGYPAQRIRRGTRVVKPADPVKTGYDFTGWWQGKVLFDFTTPVAGDITLEAGWTLKQMTVSFDTGGGTVLPDQHISYGSPVPAPAAPSRDGYRFTGWMLNGTAYDFTAPVTSDITLVAGWQLLPQTGSLSLGMTYPAVQAHYRIYHTYTFTRDGVALTTPFPLVAVNGDTSNLPATITSGTQIYVQLQTRITIQDIPVGTHFQIDLKSTSFMIPIDITRFEGTITAGDQYYESNATLIQL